MTEESLKHGFARDADFVTNWSAAQVNPVVHGGGLQIDSARLGKGNFCTRYAYH